jgi:response regulator RpfG family c-di-GMP phosphodiesterase
MNNEMRNTTKPTSATKPQRAGKCLIVDDAEFDRTLMRRVFSKNFPDVPMLMAQDIEQTRRRLKEAKGEIAIIFLDNMLPDGMGIDLVRELAEDKDFKDLPVIIVSDFPTPFMYAKANVANVREVWAKRDFIGPSIQRAMRQHARLH